MLYQKLIVWVYLITRLLLYFRRHITVNKKNVMSASLNKTFPFPYYIFILFQDPKVYVQTILDVHKKYHALVLTAFNSDAGFVAALDKVRRSAIRMNE